jgi:hypothetical protein
MSDTNTPDDQIDIPEAEPQSFADQRAKKGMSPGLKLGILVGGVFTILGASFFLSGTATDPESAMRSAPNLNATPGGTVQAENPRFRELLEQANDQRANDALNRGETFIPVPEGQLEPLNRFDRADAGQAPETDPNLITPPPSQTAEQRRVEPRVIEQRAIPAPGSTVSRPQIETTAPQNQQNPYSQAMIQQMGSITQAMTETGFMEVQDQPPPQLEETSLARGGSGDSEPPEPAAEQVIAAGAILYAETLTSSSSDLPGPVLVEVTTGPFKGSRLVGRFSTAESVDKMVVEFSSMTLPDGTSVPVAAFAVDGVSAETAVASDVNRRYISRYAPILAAAFITGYATSAAQPSQQVVSLGDGNSVVTEPSDARQNLFAGVAAASDAVGQDLVRNAPKGPEVILRSGWPIGVMFVEPVTR